MDATKKGAKGGAGGEKGGETGFLFSFKLDGAKKKTRKQRKALIGIDARGQKTQEFDRIEDKLMGFLRQRQDNSTPNDPDPEESSSTTTTSSSATSSLLASLQSHPFGSGLFHLRADTTPSPPTHSSDGHASGTTPASRVLPSQPLPPPLQPIPSLSPSPATSPSASLSLRAGACREAGLEAKAPRESGRRSRRSGQHHHHHQQQKKKQQPDFIDVEAEPDINTPVQAMGVFGHSLLPPLASASISTSPPLPATGLMPTGWSMTTPAAPSFHPLAAGRDQAGYAQPVPLPSTQRQPVMVPHPHFNGDRHAPPPYSRGFEPWPQPDAAAGGFAPAAPALQPELSAPTQRPYAALDGMFAVQSLAPHMRTHTQRHSETGETNDWRRDRSRRRLDDEERSLVAEGRERVVRTLRDLESDGTSRPGRSGQGKRRGEEMDLASTLRYKLQRLDTIYGRVAPIWTDDAHLTHFSAMSDCIRLYVVHSWPSCPLNPLALSEENIQRFLRRRSGEEERGTSLALNIYVALALGAILLGDKARAFTYYREARQQLAYLFDSFDYSVAEALFGLTYIAFSKGSMKKAIYYTTMAMQICRQLNAFHSSVYNRCLMSLFFVPTTTMAEKKRLWNEYTEKIAVLPYYDEGRLLMLDVGEGERDVDEGVQQQLNRPQQHFVSMGHNKLRMTESMRNNVRQAKVIDRVARNSMAIYLTFHALDQKCEERKSQLPTAQQDVCIQDLFTDTEEMNNVYEVLNVLVGKCKLVEQLLVIENLPVSLKAGTEISILALYGELNRRLGRSSDAINWAKRCLNTLMMHDVQYLPVGILSSLIMFLQQSYLARLKAVCAQERIDGLVFGDEDGEPRTASDGPIAAATTSPPPAQRDGRKSPVLPYPHPHRSESDGDESVAHTASSASSSTASSQHGSPTTDGDLRHHPALHQQQHPFAQQHQPHFVTPIPADLAGSRLAAAMQPPVPIATTDTSSWAAQQRAHHLRNAQPSVGASNHQSRPSAYAATPAFPHQTTCGGSGGPHTSQVASGPPAWQAMMSIPEANTSTAGGVAGGVGARPVSRRKRGSDFINKLRRWVRDGGGGGDNLQSVADLVDDFAVFLEEEVDM